MAINYPTSLDDGTSIPNPTGVNTQNNPDHAALHSNTGDAVKAVETKLGIGASTPVVSRLLFGTGTGTSAWTQLSSAQLAASLSDETGTGSVVFANTPTLVTPKTDTINEVTPANGVTIDGLNIKDNKLNTNDSVVTANITDANVTTAKIADSSITGAKLATSAISLGYAERTSAFTSTSAATWQDVTTLSNVVTVPSGGRRVKVTFFSSAVQSSSTTGITAIAINFDGTVVQQAYFNKVNNNANVPYNVLYSHVPTAASHTYKIQIAGDGTNTTTINAGTAGATVFTAGPAFILTEVI